MLPPVSRLPFSEPNDPDPRPSSRWLAWATVFRASAVLVTSRNFRARRLFTWLIAPPKLGKKFLFSSAGVHRRWAALHAPFAMRL